MSHLLDFSSLFLGTVTSAGNPANLTESEVIARYPMIAYTFSTLMVLGLLCDVALLFRVTRSTASAAPTSAPEAFRIDSRPWSLRDLWTASVVVVATLLLGELLVLTPLTLMHASEDSILSSVLTADMLLRIAILAGFAFFFYRRKIDWRQALGFQRHSSLRAIGSGVVYLLAILPPLVVVSIAYGSFCHFLGFKDDAQDIANMLASSDSMLIVGLIAVFAVVIAPVSEEFFFRGFAYPALKQRWGMWPALTIVATVFAVIHFHVPSFGPLFMLAVGLGLAYELSGSLLTPITMHALFNALNAAMLLYLRAHS